jgi:hypothetical protein
VKLNLWVKGSVPLTACRTISARSRDVQRQAVAAVQYDADFHPPTSAPISQFCYRTCRYGVRGRALTHVKAVAAILPEMNGFRLCFVRTTGIAKAMA